MPRDQSGQITFCQVHLTKWQENAAAIGLEPDAIEQMTAATEAARVAYQEQQQAQQAARSATLKLKIALAKMNKTASAIIMRVRVAESKVGKAVCALAAIPARAKASPLPPGVPTGFKLTLDSIGIVSISWD